MTMEKTRYKNVALELFEAYIEDELQIISEFSGNKKQSMAYLTRKVTEYAKRLDENVDEWVKKLKRYE